MQKDYRDGLEANTATLKCRVCGEWFTEAQAAEMAMKDEVCPNCGRFDLEDHTVVHDDWDLYEAVMGCVADNKETLEAGLSKAVYTGTDCGAWIDLSRAGQVRLGSIVEGSDAETTVHALTYPFRVGHFWDALDEVNMEACALWDEANAECEAEGDFASAECLACEREVCPWN